MFRVFCYAVLSVPCNRVLICWERADLLALFPIENITGIIENISGLPLEIIGII